MAQYSGHLSSTYYQNVAAAEFLCLDADPQDRPGSQDQQKVSAYIEHAVTVCGSLPCPPYVNGRVATCVVCSKWGHDTLAINRTYDLIDVYLKEKKNLSTESWDRSQKKKKIKRHTILDTS